MPEQTGTDRPCWYIYLVRCRDGSLYAGVTTDLVRRLAEHNGSGTRGARYTRSRRPVSLVYAETAPSRAAACKREWSIKRMAPADKLTLIENSPCPLP